MFDGDGDSSDDSDEDRPPQSVQSTADNATSVTVEEDGAGQPALHFSSSTVPQTATHGIQSKDIEYKSIEADVTELDLKTRLATINLKLDEAREAAIIE